MTRSLLAFLLLSSIATATDLSANNFTVEAWALPFHDLPVAAERRVTVPSPESPAGLSATVETWASVEVVIGRNGVHVLEHAGGIVERALVFDGPIEEWSHVAVVYLDGQPSLYLDGMLMHIGMRSTAAVVAPMERAVRLAAPATGPFATAAGGAGGGRIDELRIWSVPRTGEQIRAAMDERIDGEVPGLVTRWGEGMAGEAVSLEMEKAAASAAERIMKRSRPLTIPDFDLESEFDQGWLSGTFSLKKIPGDEEEEIDRSEYSGPGLLFAIPYSHKRRPSRIVFHADVTLKAQKTFGDGDGSPTVSVRSHSTATADEPAKMAFDLGLAGGIGGAAVELEQNYPNPFGGWSEIGFSLSAPMWVRLIVHDANGQAVVLLLDELRQAGRHSVVVEASALPASGTYIYRLTTPFDVLTKAMTVMK